MSGLNFHFVSSKKWEREQIFPAHELFKKLGNAGLMGINKPVEYGGQGLDYKYQMAFLEACGHIRASGVAMGIGQNDNPNFEKSFFKMSLTDSF